jgi:thiol-disulfide isomerase/thioredoxin
VKLERARLAGLVALAAAASVVGCSRRAAPPEPDRPDGILKLDEADFRRLREKYRGRVLLVNFWATWCEPCRQEYPDLVRLQKALGPRGLQIVGLSTDFASALGAAEKFLAEQKPSFPNYHKKSGGDDQDFINAVDKDWGGELPFSVLYDRTGKKNKTLSGKHSYADYEREVLALLR